MTGPVADRQAGQALGPELMILLIVALAGWGLLAWLGRLDAAAQDLANIAQSAARAASQAADPVTGRAAAESTVAASEPAAGCAAPATVEMVWSAGPTGTWRGGNVTVTVSCRVEHREPFTGDARPMSAADTQVIDQHRSGG